MEQQITWIGLRAGDYLIDNLLGEGAFSYVYSGFSLQDGAKRAFKVAKPKDALEVATIVKETPSQAVGFFTGGLQGVHPDTVQILRLQADKLRETDDPALVSIDDEVAEEGFGYYRMTLLEGPTLRELIKRRAVPISALVETAQALARLSENETFRYHGDLKPENILISPAGVKLIDPGYFGPLECEEGPVASAAITTPAYYPCMEPNDMLAFGLMLWECALGIHPLIGGESGFGNSNDKESFDPELVRWVRSYEQVGYYFLRPLLSLPSAAAIKPDLPVALEELLYKSLGLTPLPAGGMEKSNGFRNFSEIAEALLNVLLGSDQPEF